MDSGKPFQTIGILAILYFVFMKGASLVSDRLTFGRPRVKITGVTVTGVKLLLRFPITNNNPVPMALDYFNGALFYGTYNMAMLNIGPMSFPPGETKEVAINTFVPYQSAAGNIADMITTGNWWQSFSVGGQASVKGVSFTVPPIPIQLL